jgi:sterol 3beta-glucosyltransferase
MYITIITVGSRGDVQPYIALGKGLLRAGHYVQIIADTIFKEFVSKSGLSFSPISTNLRKILEEDISKFGHNPIRFIKYLKAQYKTFARQYFIDVVSAIINVDVIIFSPLASNAYHIAEYKNVPCIGAYLQPASPTKAFGPTNIPKLPAWLPFKGHINWHSFRINNKIFLYSVKDIINKYRKDILNLPSLSWRVYSNIDFSDLPILYGFSSQVVAKPPDWKDNLCITGYWFLEEEKNWQPPEDLIKYIEAGAPPIYVGFGSMMDKENKNVIDIVIEALAKLGQRGIISTGWNEVSDLEVPSNILFVDDVPHEWLFPKMAAVVHHGGAGTTAAGFKAGIPTIVVPFAFDQPFWGRKVFELGVGPKPIPRKKLTVDRLVNDIRSTLSTHEYYENAKRLAHKIQSEEGVSNAVQIIENIMEES